MLIAQVLHSGLSLSPLAFSTPATSGPSVVGSVYPSDALMEHGEVVSPDKMIHFSDPGLSPDLFRPMPPLTVKLHNLMLQSGAFLFSKYTFLLKY